MSSPLTIVVMGVSGCGKSSLGQAIASALRLPLVEGDDFHAPASIEKMRRGVALTDADRAAWLERLGHELAGHPEGGVLTCSALKRAYRNRLRAASPGLRFVYLRIDREEATARVQARAAQHIFPASLVDSQFQTLESPDGEDGVLTLDATLPLGSLRDRAVAWLAHAS